MAIIRSITAAALLASGFVAAAPASAAVETFASFSDATPADNFRFVNSGNSANRTTDAVLYSTATGSTTRPGAAPVRFSFTEPYISTFFTDIPALFTYNATIAKGTPAVNAFGGIVQQGIHWLLLVRDDARDHRDRAPLHDAHLCGRNGPSVGYLQQRDAVRRRVVGVDIVVDRERRDGRVLVGYSRLHAYREPRPRPDADRDHIRASRSPPGSTRR